MTSFVVIPLRYRRYSSAWSTEFVGLVSLWKRYVHDGSARWPHCTMLDRCVRCAHSRHGSQDRLPDLHWAPGPIHLGEKHRGAELGLIKLIKMMMMFIPPRETERRPIPYEDPEQVPRVNPKCIRFGSVLGLIWY